MKLFLYNLWFMLVAVACCGKLAIFTLLWKTYQSNSILRRFFAPFNYLLLAILIGKGCLIVREYGVPADSFTSVAIGFGLAGAVVEALVTWLVFMLLLSQVTTQEKD